MKKISVPLYLYRGQMLDLPVIVAEDTTAFVPPWIFCQSANSTILVVVATTFECFPKLSAELQLKIWVLVIHGARVIQVWFSKQDSEACPNSSNRQNSSSCSLP
jgi:hypothetical protein